MFKNPHIGIIVGSTRQGRFSERAASWFHKIAVRRADLSVEVVDLRDYPTPFFEEPASPAWMPPKDHVAERWAAKLAEFDGLLFVTPEYDHGYSAVLKNALDYAFQQFNRKPAAFVGYGGVGAARAIEQLRIVAVELQMAPIRKSVKHRHGRVPRHLAAGQGFRRVSASRTGGFRSAGRPVLEPHTPTRASGRIRTGVNQLNALGRRPVHLRGRGTFAKTSFKKQASRFAISGRVKGDWS